MVHITTAVWAAAALAGVCLPVASAHPGHNIEREIAERSAYLKQARSNLDHCAATLNSAGHEKRSLNRRLAKIQELRDQVQQKKRALARRATTTSSTTASATASTSTASASDDSGSAVSDSTSDYNLTTWGAEVVNTTHLSSLDVDPWTADVEDIIFANASCVLNPEGEIGPFYVQGEFVRHDITETQVGVPLYLDQQYINTNTCEPITGLYAEIFHCNTTGVYAGVIGDGNGNDDDTSNLNNTFLRGVQETDSDGVVSWRTIFPGHYGGRATHIHVISHTNATLLSNDTITEGTVRHIGQIFFDQDLISEVNDNVYPYTSNTIDIVENSVDHVLLAETQTDSDPVVDYVLLGESIEDGIFAWINIGVNPSAEYTLSVAAIYSADGGYETSSSGGFGGSSNSTNSTSS